MPRYFVWNIGCQMNAADARRVEEGLQAMGFQPAPQIEQADVIVLNTCVVRQSAEDRVWGRLHSLKPLKRRNPTAFLALMGCAVDDPEALAARFPYVDAFIRPSDVEGLLRAVAQSGFAPTTCPSERSEEAGTAVPPSPAARWSGRSGSCGDPASPRSVSPMRRSWRSSAPWRRGGSRRRRFPWC